jgi:hypothetical protein
MLSTKDKKRLEAVASKTGLTVSEFVRRLMRYYSKPDDDTAKTPN